MAYDRYEDIIKQFRATEDGKGQYVHYPNWKPGDKKGSSAFGSFGFVQNGHLKTAFNSDYFKDIKAKNPSYKEFFKKLRSKNYDDPELKHVEGAYARWLDEQSGGDIKKAALFNLTGNTTGKWGKSTDANGNMNPNSYANKIAGKRIPKDNYLPIRTQAMAGTDVDTPFVDQKGTQLSTKPTKTVPVEGAEYKPMQVLKTKQPGSNTSTAKSGFSLGDTVPYLSNLYNMTQKPAAVPRPVLNAPVQLERVNMDNDRYEVNKDYRSLQQNIDQTLDANTATYAKLAGKAGKFQKLSAINQTERNQNREIANQETSLNTAIAQGNNDKLYQTRLLGAERENVMTSQRMANFSNMTDKYTAQQNTNAKNDLEQQRIQFQLDTDPYGTLAAAMNKKKENKKYGGPMAGTVFNKLKKLK